MEPHGVDATVLRTSEWAMTCNTSSVRVLEYDVDTVGDHSVVDLPDKDKHVSLTASLQ